MRVQRTRSSASPPHSPLTRGPLGDLVAEFRERRAVLEAASASRRGSVASWQAFRSSGVAAIRPEAQSSWWRGVRPEKVAVA